MNIRQLAIGVALAAAAATPAFAQSGAPSSVPQTNATIAGTFGPASDSVGYPSATDPTGRLQTTNVGPQNQVAPAR